MPCLAQVETLNATAVKCGSPLPSKLPHSHSSLCPRLETEPQLPYPRNQDFASVCPKEISAETWRKWGTHTCQWISFRRKSESGLGKGNRSSGFGSPNKSRLCRRRREQGQVSDPTVKKMSSPQSVRKVSSSSGTGVGAKPARERLVRGARVDGWRKIPIPQRCQRCVRVCVCA